jgi:hypothetical protein
MAGELSVAMRDRGVGATVEADRDRQQDWRAVCGHEGQGCRGGCGGRQADNMARELSVVMQELHFLQCRNSPDKTRDITRELWRSLMMSSQARGM